ncbi:MFS transporter [Oenococcus sicerae]|uniref:MFS transporter n=1 Tax=Oenococcus sicerae TaxID=2203724 RepID=A0AAJ1RAB3_9LACO|nr:MFS transporter [Oenococcus sicerae]MDN6901079.1 MFS transporter [Oenococcus sicerae]
MKKIRIQCVLLTALAFLMGLSQFMIVGILNNLSHSFHVPIDQTGTLVTWFAIVYALTTPIINLSIGYAPLYKVLMVLFSLFAFGNVLTAIADNFNLLLISRLLTALASGPTMSIAITFAAAIAPPEKRSWIVSWVFSGFSIASVFGVPIGTWISDKWNWRLLFWIIFVLSIISIELLYLLLPHQLRQKKGHGFFRQLMILSDKQILLGILIPVFNFAAIYMVYTYLKPLLINKLGFSSDHVIIILFLYGLCGLVSNQISGHIANRRWIKNLGKFLVIQAISLLTLFLTSNLKWFSLIAILSMALTMSVLNSPIELFYMEVAEKNYPQSLVLASSFESIFSNVGVAIGSAAGGYTVSILGLNYLGLMGGLFSVLAISVLIVLNKIYVP